MLIEFFGLPGAGKSTLSRRVAEALKARGIAVDEITYNLDHRRSVAQRLVRKTGHAITLAGTEPRTACADVARIFRTRQLALTTLGKVAFNWLYVAAVTKRKRAPARVTFLDQGIAQALWSIGFDARQEDWLDLLLADNRLASVRPNLIIHVCAKASALRPRLSARTKRASRMDGRGQLDQTLERARELEETIIEELSACGIPIMPVDNNDPAQLEVAAERIANAVEAMRQRLYSQANANSKRDRAMDAAPSMGKVGFSP